MWIRAARHLQARRSSRHATIAGIEAGTVAVDKAAAYSGILLRSFARLDAKKMPTAIAIGMAR